MPEEIHRVDVSSGDDSHVEQPHPVLVTCTLEVTLSDGRRVQVHEEMSADLIASSRAKVALLFASLTKRAIRACNAAGSQAKAILSH